MNRTTPHRIVFINPPLSLQERYGSLAEAGSTMPSLGLLSLAAVAREKGFECGIIEASSLQLTLEECLEQVKSWHPHIVGITACTTAVVSAAEVAKRIKEWDKNIITIIGGPHITALPEETMESYPQFDIGVIGEGEETLLALLGKIETGSSLDAIKGLIFQQNSKVFITEPRSFIAQLDDLPLPAWDLLPGFPQHYKPAALKVRRLPAAHLVSSRGCPFQCIFCDRSVFGRKYRIHSAEYMMELIKKLYHDFGVREISFEDDTFTLFTERLVKLCTMIMQEGLDISWSCNGRVEAVKPETLKIMKQAGCWQIAYGIESGEQRILDIAKKGITVDEIKCAIQWTHEAGIFSKGFFILGFPQESEETLQRTIDFATELKLDDVSISLMTPFPGTEIYKWGDKYGSLERDWKKMNLLDAVYIPQGLTGEKLLRYQKKFLRGFYLRPRILLSYLKRILKNPSLIPYLFKAFIGYLKKIR
jgi:anaerobic magnesium-protoporphyrin IX monomethyl ester cyclase